MLIELANFVLMILKILHHLQFFAVQHLHPPPVPLTHEFPILHGTSDFKTTYQNIIFLIPKLNHQFDV